MAHFWIVTVAGALIAIVFGIRCTVPSPAQVSLAAMSLECVTTVPFSVPQAKPGGGAGDLHGRHVGRRIVPDAVRDDAGLRRDDGWVVTVTL